MELILVIHWGATTVQEQTVSYENEMEESMDPEQAPVVEIESFTRQTERSRFLNAKLLGLGELQDLPYNNKLREQLVDAIDDERYYILVVAYDVDRLLDDSRGNPMVWVSRFSVPRRSTRFGEALPTIARVAGPYFGQNASTGLHRVDPAVGEAIFGELEEVENSDHPPPSAARENPNSNQ